MERGAVSANTDLERPSSWGKELKTGSLPGVFSQVGDELNAVVADIKRALLLFICRDNEARRILSGFIGAPAVSPADTNLCRFQSSRRRDC